MALKEGYSIFFPVQNMNLSPKFHGLGAANPRPWWDHRSLLGLEHVRMELPSWDGNSHQYLSPLKLPVGGLYRGQEHWLAGTIDFQLIFCRTPKGNFTVSRQLLDESIWEGGQVMNSHPICPNCDSLIFLIAGLAHSVSWWNSHCPMFKRFSG